MNVSERLDARDALRDFGGRFTDLVRSVPDPGRAATAHWSVADTAAHTATLMRLLRILLQPADRPLMVVDPQLLSGSTVDGVAELNRQLMRVVPERRPEPIADMIQSDLGAVLDAAAVRDPEELVDWLGGSRVPVAGLLAHMVNELMLHGWDIARAYSRPWPLPPAAAALFVEHFLVGIIKGGYGRMLDGDVPDYGGRIAVEFRSHYTTTAVLVLDRGRVTLGEAGRDIDVRVRFDPSALNLVLFGRVSRTRAALTGRLVVTGRRPWLLLPFLRKVRMPPG